MDGERSGFGAGRTLVRRTRYAKATSRRKRKTHKSTFGLYRRGYADGNWLAGNAAQWS